MRIEWVDQGVPADGVLVLGLDEDGFSVAPWHGPEPVAPDPGLSTAP